MRKLVWKNSLGDEINLTKTPFGITNWEGFSNAPLNIQSQQVPIQDGSVFLDALIENRDLSVTLSICDNNDLEKRYELERQLIHILNPKLGEGYLIYTNDFISKRIKCIPQIPLFPNKNSNDPGTQKGELSWTACEPYWEDLEETSVFLKSGERYIINNEGDVPANVEVDFYTSNATNPLIKNISEDKLIKLNGEFYNGIRINTNVGQKKINNEKIDLVMTVSGSRLRSVIYSDKYHIFLSCGEVGIYQSKDGEIWQFVNLSGGNELYSMTYAKTLDKFVAVGTSRITTSNNGVIWTNISCNTELHGITYSENLEKFIAVGQSGTIISSTDGTTWNTENSGVSNYLYGITYSDRLGMFVAVGTSGTILTSTDGVTWTSRTSNTTKELYNITYSDRLGIFVAVGDKTTVTSTDGVTWTSETVIESIKLYSVIYIEPMKCFIAVGGNVYTRILKSEDGINWVKESVAENYNSLYSVVYSSELAIIVAVGHNGIIVDKKNSNQWDIITYSKTTEDLNGMAYSKTKDKYVAVGNNSVVLTSNDGMKWERQSLGGTSYLKDVIYCESKGYFMAVGSATSTYPRVFISDDGVNWDGYCNNMASSILYGVVYSKKLNLFVAVGSANNVYGSTIITSTDGKNWTRVYSDETDRAILYSVEYSEELEKFVAVGWILNNYNYGVYFTSTDGVQWTKHTTDYSLRSVTYVKTFKKFYLCGKGIYTYNGEYIQKENNLDTICVSYSEKLGFFIGIISSSIRYSSDGKNWNTILYTVIPNFTMVKDDVFFIGGRKGTIFYTIFSLFENLISQLTSDSDMTLGLKIGENEIFITEADGDLNGRIIYRQKYIGV